MNRNQRVIQAFINCVKNGIFTADYAITLIEDENKYGYLTNSDKEFFYNAIENFENETTENFENEIIE